MMCVRTLSPHTLGESGGFSTLCKEVKMVEMRTVLFLLCLSAGHVLATGSC